MSEETSENDPLPAVPLDYFQQHREPWVPMVRAVTWLTVIFEGYYILSYFVEVACFFWQQTQPPYLRSAIRGTPIAVHVPMMFAALIIFIGAVDSLKLIDSGRRLVVRGALLMMIFVPPTEIWNAFYYHIVQQHWRYGEPFAVMYFARYGMAAVGGLIFPFFIWTFFRRAEVREVFAQGHFQPQKN